MVRFEAGKLAAWPPPINQVREDWDCTRESSGDEKGEPDRRDVHGLGSIGLMIDWIRLGGGGEAKDESQVFKVGPGDDGAIMMDREQPFRAVEGKRSKLVEAMS